MADQTDAHTWLAAGGDVVRQRLPPRPARGHQRARSGPAADARMSGSDVERLEAEGRLDELSDYALPQGADR